MASSLASSLLAGNSRAMGTAARRAGEDAACRGPSWMGLTQGLLCLPAPPAPRPSAFNSWCSSAALGAAVVRLEDTIASVGLAIEAKRSVTWGDDDGASKREFHFLCDTPHSSPKLFDRFEFRLQSNSCPSKTQSKSNLQLSNAFHHLHHNPTYHGFPPPTFSKYCAVAASITASRRQWWRRSSG